MPYKEQVIHFSAGVNDYMGELQFGLGAEHPLGKNWYPIKNPCIVQTNEKGAMRLMAIQGPGNFYKRYIDIRIPEDSIIEIRTVDRGGDLMAAYLKESVREKSLIIQSPGANLKLV